MSTASSPMIPPGRIRLSVDEYMELPNDGKRYEILSGELYVTPAPAPKHQKVSLRVQTILVQALMDTGMGDVYYAPIDVILGRHDICQPDILFIAKERLKIVGEKNIQGAPDLVIEILSPSTRRTDIMVKSKIYAQFGVTHYWVVDPDIDKIEFFRLGEGVYSLTLAASSPTVVEAPAFPGLKIPLERVFS